MRRVEVHIASDFDNRSYSYMARLYEGDQVFHGYGKTEHQAVVDLRRRYHNFKEGYPELPSGYPHTVDVDW